MYQMTIDEALEENLKLSKKKVLSILREHQADSAEFFEEVGIKKVYTSRDVFYWLGY